MRKKKLREILKEKKLSIVKNDNNQQLDYVKA
ncbi:hypothetical protein PBAC_30960 [Pedobacter glucosidilyticus]|nr:hypothetical protein PBAC_30960 [Pedobacter glucosidilyticus]